ncbi:MAG: ATP-binding protein [Candidatus Thorarchaeota archaeon]
MIIAVASGKGGTGKTTVAVNMALSLGDVNLIDCDVEEPNAHTLLHPKGLSIESVTVPMPLIDIDRCTLCATCANFCEFNAIFVGKKVLVYPEICHSCGGCSLVCPEGAIEEEAREVGNLYSTNVDGVRLVYGELNVGEPVAIPVIKAVKEKIDRKEITILDAPPGTACPVIETMQDSDFVVLVTEPTPFGLHDLSMTVDVIRELDIPHGIVLNRVGVGNDEVKEFCRANDIPILLEIPFDRRIAELYSNGVPFVQELPEWRERFRHLFEVIKEMSYNGH